MKQDIRFQSTCDASINCTYVVQGWCIVVQYDHQAGKTCFPCSCLDLILLLAREQSLHPVLLQLFAYSLPLSILSFIPIALPKKFLVCYPTVLGLSYSTNPTSSLHKQDQSPWISNLMLSSFPLLTTRPKHNSHPLDCWFYPAHCCFKQEGKEINRKLQNTILSISQQHPLLPPPITVTRCVSWKVAGSKSRQATEEEI